MSAYLDHLEDQAGRVNSLGAHNAEDEAEDVCSALPILLEIARAAEADHASLLANGLCSCRVGVNCSMLDALAHLEALGDQETP